MLRRVAFVAAALVAAPAASAQTVWYVDDGASPGGGGTGWYDAFQFLQDALAAAAAGDEIRVGEGTYTPDLGNGHFRFNRSELFRIDFDVTIVGGWRGIDSFGSPDDRGFLSTLSGDLVGDDPATGDNSRHVVFVTSGTSARLEAVTLAAGSDPASDGPNLLASGATLELVDVTIARGSGALGGGASITGGRADLAGCVFDSNDAALDGGGLYLKGGAVTIERCTFTGNSSAAAGGGLAQSGGGSLAIRDTLFFANSAVDAGGAQIEEADLLRCTIDDNLASNHAGGLRIASVGASNSRVADSLILRNDALTAGGIAFDAANGGLTLEVIGCTISRNFASSVALGGGILFDSPDAGALVVRSSILWLNRGGNRQHEPAQISGPAAALAIDFCDVAGWTGGYGGSGNYAADPLFVSTTDYSLQATSPCIDAGDPGFAPAPGEERDLAGTVRRLDGDLDLSEIVDAGAFEFTNVVLDVIGTAGPGDLVTTVLSGTPGLPAVLIIGLAGAAIPIEPYGTILVDVYSMAKFIPWPAAPSSVDHRLPPDFPSPGDFYVQAFVSSGLAGNLSNLEIVPPE